MAERGKIFKEAPILVPDRSWFDMSFDHLFACNFGELVPVTCMECLAGDVVHAKTDTFARVAPMIAPAFGKVNIFSYHFYVRDRDIWTNFDKFFTNNDQKKTWQQNIDNFVAPVMPYVGVHTLVYPAIHDEVALISASIVSEGIEDSDYYDLVVPTAYRDNGFHFLVIYSFDGGTKYFANIYKHAYDIPAKNRAMVITFVPNKDEADEGQLYNPLSNGSLLDYLGVDCSHLYDDQLSYYDDSVDTIWGQETITEPNQSERYHSVMQYFAFDPTTDTFSGEIPTEYISEFLEDSDLTSSLDEFINYSGIQECDVNGSLSSFLYDFFRKHAVYKFEFRLVDSRALDDMAYISYGGLNGYHTYNDDVWTNHNLIGVDSYIGSNETKISTLPIRAYRFIYDEYFRDQNYIEVNANTDFARDGYDVNIGLTPSKVWDYFTLERKSWEHDPYTSGLPGPQRGPAVRFLRDSTLFVNPDKDVPTGTRYRTGTSINIGEDLNQVFTNAQNQTSFSSIGGPQSSLMVDLSAATIENFRWANSMQKYLEKMARTGGRYYEYMRGIFGVDIPDSKLNRPIYLSGDKTPVQISEVVQTSANDEQTGQALGSMAGRAVAVGSDDYLEFTAPDNGFFIELVCVVPRVQYVNGLDPMFTRETFMDYPIPEFAQLGEEYVKQQELFFTGRPEKDEKAFAYQSRYYQWKYKRDKISGSFKDSLDFWHFGRKFDSVPVAGKKFLEVDSDYRQFSVDSKNFEHVYVTMWHDIQVNRCLPEFGVPTL